MKLEAKLGQKTRSLHLEKEGEAYQARVGSKRMKAEVVEGAPGSLLVRIGARTYDVTYTANGSHYRMDLGGPEVAIEILDPRRPAGSKNTLSRAQGRHEIRAAMPGKIVALKIASGEQVQAGQAVLVMEAMKMENEVSTPWGGKVLSLAVTVGQTVETGTVLAVIE